MITKKGNKKKRNKKVKSDYECKTKGRIKNRFSLKV